MNVCAQAFADNLDSKNLTYSVSRDDDRSTVITFPYKQRRTSIIFSGEDGIQSQFQTVIESVPEEKVMDVIVVCNSLNTQYRFVKFVVDSDNDLMNYSDAILTPETAGEECFEVLLRTLQIIDEARPTFMRTIYAS
ncbi:MAG: YbjN domain-containing protein [Oscillospiraceae bacterium]|nr:YbjN domain-containing protein [Oscillospiraceae bacterium]